MKNISSLAIVLSLVAVPATAQVASRPPTGTLAGNWSNNSTGQNFLTQFVLGAPTALNSMTIYTGQGYGTLGGLVDLRIRSDSGGSPASTDLYNFTAPIVSQVPQGANFAATTADFTPVDLAAGTYWIGMSGDNYELSWDSFNNGGPVQPAYQRQLYGGSVVSTPNIYTLAYSLNGVGINGGVPEPATWAMMLLGFGGIGLTMRRKPKPVLTPAA